MRKGLKGIETGVHEESVTWRIACFVDLFFHLSAQSKFVNKF